jgi:hypothetical protein
MVARAVWAVMAVWAVPVGPVDLVRLRLPRVLPVAWAVTAAAAAPVVAAGPAAMVVWHWARAARVRMAVAAMVAPVVPRPLAVMVVPVRLVVPARPPVVRVAGAVMPVLPVVRARPG